MVDTSKGIANTKSLKVFSFKAMPKKDDQNQLRNPKVTYQRGCYTDSTFIYKYITTYH